MNQLLFELPTRPRQRLCDEPVAERIADAVIRRIGDFREGESGDREDMVLAIMATNSDDADTVLAWLAECRPETGWLWELQTNELHAVLCEVAEQVVPNHKRAGRFG